MELDINYTFLTSYKWKNILQDKLFVESPCEYAKMYFVQPNNRKIFVMFCCAAKLDLYSLGW